MKSSLEIREIRPDEFEKLGNLMVGVYSNLQGFPTQIEQPDYYEMLSNVGSFNEQEATKVLVAKTSGGILVGGVVYFSDMARYGSGGSATNEKMASGIRLLGVDPKYRKAGIGKALTKVCIRMAMEKGHTQVILHTTQAMRVAWELYLKLGFNRSTDLDFMQGKLPVFGFRLELKQSQKQV